MDSEELAGRFAGGSALVGPACMGLAHVLNERLPDGREKALAMTKLEEVLLWADAALDRAGDRSAAR